MDAILTIDKPTNLLAGQSLGIQGCLQEVPPEQTLAEVRV